MDMRDEATYEWVRTEQWLSRRRLLGASAAVGLAAAAPVVLGRPARAAGMASTATAASGIVKDLPEELFIEHTTNAEMRFEAMSGQGYRTPIDRFFVRNHTSTPLLDARTWQLRVFGTGLRGNRTRLRPVTFSYEDLLGLPAASVTAYMECAGNARSFFTTQQGQPVPGTPWRLGAIGVARWRGVKLSTLLERAGLTRAAVDVMPTGLDPHFIDDKVDKGSPRRPLSIEKALDDVILAYEMNGKQLPPDHGFPVRLVVPSWVGMASIKWVGEIEVSDKPLFSPWNTEYYRLFGPSYPPEGSPPITRQVIRSAFELPADARIPAGRPQVLHGRSWSGNGRIRRVEVSTDGGASWRPAVADPGTPRLARGWLQWSFRWRPHRPGPVDLMARATDETGATQPRESPFNKFGYLFGAVVRHRVTVA